MSMIILGEGAGAIEVEDGASVPLTNRPDMAPLNRRGHVSRLGTSVLLTFPYGAGEAVAKLDTATGQPIGPWHFIEYIDLDALRRERAPKVEMVFRCGMPAPDGEQLDLEPVGVFIKSPTAQTWVHRPGAHQESWAAFDAALKCWMEVHGADRLSPRTGPYDEKLLQAARALGYGSKT